MPRRSSSSPWGGQVDQSSLLHLGFHCGFGRLVARQEWCVEELGDRLGLNFGPRQVGELLWGLTWRSRDFRHGGVADNQAAHALFPRSQLLPG